MAIKINKLTTIDGLQERNIRDWMFEPWFINKGCGSNRAVNLSTIEMSNSQSKLPSSSDNSDLGNTTLRP